MRKPKEKTGKKASGKKGQNWTMIGSIATIFFGLWAVFAYFFPNNGPVVLPPSAEAYTSPQASTPITEPTSMPAENQLATPTFVTLEKTGDLAVSQFVALYYDAINAATSLESIKSGWSHLSFALQGASDHNIDLYASEWFKYKVQYEIFRCTDTEVEVELTYFPKSDTLFQRPGQTLFLRYTVYVVSGEWIFDSGKVIQNRNTNCVLAQTNKP